jgi:hypothetical protein
LPLDGLTPSAFIPVVRVPFISVLNELCHYISMRRARKYGIS